MNNHEEKNESQKERTSQFLHLIAESVDQTVIRPQLGLSFLSRYYFHYCSPSISFSEFNKFTPILLGLVKVILGNVKNQYLKLKYTSQVEGK